MKTSTGSPSRSLARILAAAFAAMLVCALAAPALAAAPAGGHGNKSDHFNWTELDFKSKDIHGGTLEEGEEPMSPPMILMLLNFGVVVFIVGWKVAPPIKRFVVNRHITIKDALEESARLREEAMAKLDEYTKRVSDVEGEVDQLIAGIRADAEAEKKRIIESAEAQAAAMKREAEARITAELERARAELEREVIGVAVAAAEAIIRSKANADDHTKLIDSFIGDVNVKASTSPQERA